jgi:hypothetical protein
MTMVLAPLLLLAGAAALWGLYDDEDEQAMAARQAAMDRTHLGANLLTASLMLNVFVVAALGNLVAASRPRLAAWGAGVTIVGLLVQVWFWGIDVVGRGLAESQDAATAAQIMEDADAPTFMVFLAPTIILGWFILAFAAWRAGVLPAWRAAAFALTGLLPVGVIGGAHVLIPVAFLGFAVGVLPLGISLMRGRASAS